MAGRLQDKVAIITGAGRGIGAAIARIMAQEGARIAVLDIDDPAAIAVTGDIRAAGGTAESFHADITDQALITAVMAQVTARLGPPDILVNNAGINVFRDPIELTAADWTRCLAVDLEGAWHCIRAVLPSMLERGGGSIVNIASTHSFSIIPGCFPYPVAKHGLIGLTRALAIEYGPKNIRVNAVAPGYIATRLNLEQWEAASDPAAARKAVEDLIPLRRIGTPEQVAWATVYLASDEAGFTTASILTMDGGRSVVYHD
jgi:NAD(P)-dependent dehydrogenase (short-subunit alcohol dehydrogenase family)